MRSLFSFACLGLAASVAVAQTAPAPKTIEVSPFAGYFVGGTIFDYRLPGMQNLAFANDVSYGLRVGWNATTRIEPEFEWSRTATKFSPDHPEYLHSLDVDYFLAGASYNFGESTFRPYASIDVGAARVDAIDFVAETLFTASAGVGIKCFLTPNVGIRLDARGYASKTNQGLRDICTTFDPGGDPGGPVVPIPCVQSWLLNGQFTGGLVIAF